MCNYYYDTVWAVAEGNCVRDHLGQARGIHNGGFFLHVRRVGRSARARGLRAKDSRFAPACVQLRADYAMPRLCAVLLR